MKNNRKLLMVIYEYTQTLVFAVVTVVIVFCYFFRLIGVDGESMEPSLQDRDRLLVSNLFYEPERGDIVMFTKYRPNEYFPNLDTRRSLVKRVIATEGQVVDIDFDTHEVRVDGELLDEHYIAEPVRVSGDTQFPVTVPPGCIFVMGDNRNHSLDSRSSVVGMVDERMILGRVLLRVSPLSNFGTVPHD